MPDDECVESFWDNVTGKLLPPDLVAKARQEELEFLRGFGVYKIVPYSEAKGFPIIGVRWVDVNKADEEGYMVRSRLVAKEF